jgi:glycosyltransferase involved in cell wall biosynthesis
VETLTFVMTSTFYAGKGIGGDANHVKWLSEELTSLGHEVHVLFSKDAHDCKNKGLIRESEACGVHLHPIDSPLNLSAYMSYVMGKSGFVDSKFNQLIKEAKPDVVHHHNISLLGYGILKKRSDYLNIYTAHDYWFICQQSNLLKNRLTPCDSQSCFTCSLHYKKPLQIWRRSNGLLDAINELDILLAPCNYLGNELSKKLDVKVSPLPNFVPKSGVLEDFLVFSNFFLYAGMLEKHKGIMNLISVFKDIQDKTDARLLIVGSGSESQKIRNFVKINKLEGRIVMLGWVDKNYLLSLIKNANALIMPSIWFENCPLIALESLSLGTPVISSNMGGLPEIVGKINFNLVYEGIDQLKQIVLNFDKTRYCPEEIKKVYFDNYSPNVFIDKYYELLEHYWANS